MGIHLSRVVCANTFAAALAEKEGIFKIRHNSTLLDDLPEWFANAWGAANKRIEIQKLAMEGLVTLHMTPELIEQSLAVALPVGNLIFTGNPKADELRQNQYDSRERMAMKHRLEVMERYEATDEAANYGQYSDTAYHLLGAFAEWADHFAPARTDSSRALKAFTGIYAQSKQVLGEFLLKQV